jgi:hypothetical protein
MVKWYLDEGLGTFRRQWKARFPRATVWSIGDSAHSTNPRASQHAPDDGRSGGPGDDKDEVDALDLPPGGGVTMDDLWDTFYALHEARDPRLFYAILGDKIYSSVTQPWKIRKYNGKKHGHLHLSVNDKYDANDAEWRIDRMVNRKIEFKKVEGVNIPELRMGDEDPMEKDEPGYWHIHRIQNIVNWKDKSLPPLIIDGIYGPVTSRKLGKVLGTNGKKLSIDDYLKIHGISRS